MKDEAWLETEWEENLSKVSIVKIPPLSHPQRSKGFLFHGVKSEPRLGNFFSQIPCTLQHRKKGNN